MNKYDEKADRIRAHLATHPHDYQSVISLFKMDSASIEYERQQRRNKKMALIAKFRRKKDGERA